MSMVTPDGGLTSLGYAVSGIAAALLLVAACWIHFKTDEQKRMPAKQMAFCGMAMILLTKVGVNIPYIGFTSLIPAIIAYVAVSLATQKKTANS